MRRTMPLLAAALLTAIGFTACGSDDDEFTQENLAEQLEDQGLFEAEEAECVAEVVFDELDEDELEDVQDSFGDNGDLPPALQDALTTAVGDCISLGEE